MAKRSTRPSDSSAGLPETIAPQLATLARRPPATGDWRYEVKFDGYRLMCRLDWGRVKLITRGGHDWTVKMRALATAIEEMPVDNAWLDGEVVVLTETGIPDFNALQNAFDRRSTAQLTFFAFDIPFLNGRDLREVPLSQRRELLGELIAQTSSERVRFSESFTEDPESLLASACRMRLEGIIGKRADAPYRSGRSSDWIKLLRAFFVVDRLRHPSNQGLRRLCAIAMSLISFVRTRYLHFLCVETDVGGVLCHRCDGQALPA